MIKRKPVKHAMLENDYSKSYANVPQVFMKQQATKDLIETFEKVLQGERDAALLEMKKKRKNAKYSELTTAVQAFTKLDRLLNDKPTEMTEIKDLADAMRGLAK